MKMGKFIFHVIEGSRFYTGPYNRILTGPLLCVCEGI